MSWGACSLEEGREICHINDKIKWYGTAELWSKFSGSPEDGKKFLSFRGNFPSFLPHELISRVSSEEGLSCLHLWQQVDLYILACVPEKEVFICLIPHAPFHQWGTNKYYLKDESTFTGQRSAQAEGIFFPLLLAFLSLFWPQHYFQGKFPIIPWSVMSQHSGRKQRSYSKRKVEERSIKLNYERPGRARSILEWVWRGGVCGDS